MQLFDKWDQDKSGSLDMKEVEKAIRKGQANLSAEDLSEQALELTNKFDLNVDQSNLLGRSKGADIAKKKADKDKMNFKAAEKVLSPRSLQLKEAAEKEERQKQAEMLAKLEKEDSDGQTWTAAKWLNSRGGGDL